MISIFLASLCSADELYNSRFEEVSVETINLRGLDFLFKGHFEEALVDFDVVLDEDRLNETALGVALWGRLLCHAYTGQEEEAFNDLFYIRSYFIDNVCYPCFQSFTSTHSSKSVSFEIDHQIVQIADFANPNERLSPAACKDRVKSTANVMRLFTVKIPNRALAEAINFTILELENAACRCCDRTHWTECLTPIIDSWNYLRKSFEKGVSIAPHLAGPGR